MNDTSLHLWSNGTNSWSSNSGGLTYEILKAIRIYETRFLPNRDPKVFEESGPVVEAKEEKPWPYEWDF